MKKLYFYFLITILFSILVYGISEEQSLLAKVIVNPAIGILNVSPSNLLVNAPPLSLVEKNLTFFQENGNQDLNVSLFLEVSEINTWVSFSENNLIVKPTEIKNIIAYIDIPNITTGIHSGNIHAITNTQDLLIPVNITVTDKYKIDIKIDALERIITAGKNISVFTELIKTKEKVPDPDVEGKITVGLLYNVLKGKDLIATLTTTMDVENSNEKTVSIHIPTNATKSSYTVKVTATHLDKVANDKDNFLVRKNLLTIFLKFFR